MTTLIGVAEPPTQMINIHLPFADIIASSRIDMTSEIVILERELSLEGIRLMHLIRYRNIFGLVSLVLLLAAGASLLAGIAYELPFAFCLSFFGTYIVFARKVENAR